MAALLPLCILALSIPGQFARVEHGIYSNGPAAIFAHFGSLALIVLVASNCQGYLLGRFGNFSGPRVEPPKDAT